ncbi:MAG: alpha-2-macroglobulin family protein, partial [Alphaproteobacteria bacterium]
LYAERGVYRPGETVHMSALVRDAKAVAVGELPVTFIVSKPDGTEHSKVSITGDVFGGYQFDIPISGAARSGNWSVRAILDDETQRIGHGNFQVEDFVPQRIRAKLMVEKTFAEPGETFEALVDSAFLYGAPAAGLKGEMTVTVNRNPQPFEGYESYAFGLVQEDFYQEQLAQTSFETDAEGQAPVTVDLTKLPQNSHPLRLEMLASVFDVSGRPVYAGWTIPLRTRDVEVGLRRAKDAPFDENGDSAFEAVALDKEGKPVTDRGLHYEWFREVVEYTWYQQGGRWNTRTTIFDESLAEGDVTTDARGMARFERVLGQGRYRVEVRDKDGTSIASQRFFIGWWSSGASPNAPDQLELTVDADDLTSGDKVKAFVKAPFAGTAYVAVLGDGVLWTKSFDLPEEGREFEFKPEKSWAPGAYLTVTAYRPDVAAPSRLPIRAMGFKWLTVDRASHEATVSFDLPETVVPRQSVTLPFEVKGLKGQRQKMRLTIAAVDEGILQLTDFASPNPGNHYLSQRALGYTIRDIYGQLIKPMEGARGNLRTGGDKMMRPMTEAEMKAQDENAQGNTTRVVKTVALYHKEIDVGADGQGTLTLELPDFNGRLRLMAVAYGASVVGQGDDELIVRDPVVADVLLPRFLAPGDKAEAPLTLHNLTDVEKLLKWSVTATSGVTVLDRANGQIKLKAKEQTEVTLPIAASDLGDAKITLRVTAEGLDDVERSWDIAVRPAQPFVTTREMVKLQPGETAGKLSGYDAFLESTLRGTFTLATRPEFDVPELLEALDRYPYGCTEQTVSRALPLLYFGDVAEEYGKDFDSTSLHLRVDQAIARVMAHQTYDGSFAIWSSAGEARPWLTAYAVDFLTRAQEKDFDVSPAGYAHAVKWLKDYAVNERGEDYSRAYAFYVLARIGEMRASDLRYYAENDGGKQRTRLAYGHVAAALAILGEKKLAEDFFVKAIKTRRPISWNGIYDYGSDMRDASALAALISETLPDANRVLELAETIEEYRFNRRYMSTQEQAWLLLATNAIATAPGAEMTVEVDGETWGPRAEAARWSLGEAARIGDMTVINKGSAPVRFIQSLRGVPSEALPTEAKGFEIARTYFDVDGNIVDPAKAKQHDLMVVLI